MRSQRCRERRIAAVLDAELMARPFDERRDRGIVDVADAGEEVMLDLEIQPAEQPARGETVAREIDASFYLMNGPRLVDVA